VTYGGKVFGDLSQAEQERISDSVTKGWELGSPHQGPQRGLEWEIQTVSDDPAGWTKRLPYRCYGCGKSWVGLGRTEWSPQVPE
jgi:hypothetical protein